MGSPLWCHQWSHNVGHPSCWFQNKTGPIYCGVSCQEGPTRHYYAWQIGPFWQDTLDMSFLNGCLPITWWRHQMETFFALLALCAGNSTVTGEFPSQRPVMRRFDDFFDLLLNKRLSKQSWGWWFEMPSCPLWHHCNEVRSFALSHQYE